MNESWLPVAGFEGFYEVSDLGRVKSLARIIYRRDGVRQTYKEKILKPGVGKTAGHLSVGLRKVTYGTQLYVHRLVLEAFVGPCPEGMESLHADGNPANNMLANLSYNTHTVNMHDKRTHGTQYQSNFTHCASGHSLGEDGDVYLTPKGHRICRVCHRARNQEYKQRLRERRQ